MVAERQRLAASGAPALVGSNPTHSAQRFMIMDWRFATSYRQRQDQDPGIENRWAYPNPGSVQTQDRRVSGSNPDAQMRVAQWESMWRKQLSKLVRPFDYDLGSIVCNCCSRLLSMTRERNLKSNSSRPDRRSVQTSSRVRIPSSPSGLVAEWLKAPVCKTGVRQCTASGTCASSTIGVWRNGQTQQA